MAAGADKKFDDQWVPLIHGFIQKAPPGSLADVCMGCRQLAGVQVPDELVWRSCADYRERHLCGVPLPNMDHTGIICESARAGSRAQKVIPYTDPKTDQVFMVDQETEEVVDMKKKVKGDDLSSELVDYDVENGKPFKLALDKALNQYVAERYPDPSMGLFQDYPGSAGSSVYNLVGKEYGGDIELRMMVSSRRSRRQGQWGGNWSSQWRILFTPEQDKPADLGGVLEFKTHYSEDGNVHLRRKHVRKSKVHETTDPEKWAKEVVDVIRKIEDDFHNATDDICSAMGAGALKSLRRVLPLTKERFDWRPMRHSLVQDLKSVEGKADVEREG